MKYNIYNLVIEVTRKCNMNCEHCLRGEAQNIDIDHVYIDKFLDNVKHIDFIAFSGGEPSLNLAAIEYTLMACKRRNIEVGSFYIVTNGKTNILPLSIVSLKWYAYCYEKELCGLALSKDMFHDDIDSENVEILQGLTFYNKDKFTDFDHVALINSGRAEGLNGFGKISVDKHNEELTVDEWNNIESMIYLSANGDIRTNCDTAYDDNKYVIGNIQDSTLEEIIHGCIQGEEEMEIYRVV